MTDVEWHACHPRLVADSNILHRIAACPFQCAAQGQGQFAVVGDLPRGQLQYTLATHGERVGNLGGARSAADELQGRTGGVANQCAQEAPLRVRGGG